MKNISDKFVEKAQADILCLKHFYRKSCPLSDNVLKYVRTRQATDENIIRHMPFACWINKATGTH
jgi:hypothetical protein